MTILIDGPDQILHQWDKGQRLLLVNVEGKIRVDFARCGDTKGIPSDAYADGGNVYCDIPDTLLMDNGQLMAYVRRIGDNREETVFVLLLNILPAPKPGDYVEPEEVLRWHDLEERISELEQNDVSAEQIGAAVEKYLEENPVEVPEPDLTGYAKEQWVEDNYQPKGKYLTEVPEGYAKTEDIPTEPEDIGADPKGTAASAVSEHNVDTDSHNDIRLELKSLSDRLTAFFDSDDATLDELSEIVAYITSNKSLIDSITTSKINVADIVNNLTTNVATKPLSAAQGVVLKGLIDTLNANLSKYALASAIPTKVSQLHNDSGYLSEHQDISGKLDASALPTAINTALAQAKSSGEFDGAPGKDGADGQPGKDGTSPVVSVSAITGGHRITVTDKNGTKTVDVMDGSDGNDGQPGSDGSPGQNGKDGNGIKSAVLNADYTLTLTFDDGTSYTTPSIRGATGATGGKGDKGDTGATGATGPAGKDGYTPVRGVDYYTEADKAELVRQVLESIGTPIFGVVDENNNIILTGELGDGTYSIKYEMEDGSTVNIGNLVVDTNVYYSVTNSLTNCTNSNTATEIAEGESYSATITAKDGYELKSVSVTMGGAPVTVSGGVINIASVTGNIVITAVAEEIKAAYINQLPLSVNADGSDYRGTNNEDGYKVGYRLSKSNGGAETAATGMCCSGFMPAITSDTFRVKNITQHATDSWNFVMFYDSNKNYLTYTTLISSNASMNFSDGMYRFRPNSFAGTENTAFIRICAGVISEDTIVTRNEEIV